MTTEALVLAAVSVVTIAFVALTIGGSSGGASYGPAVGSGVLTVRQAGALMALSALAGSFVAGLPVVETVGEEFVPAETFTITAALVVSVLTGIGILIGNLRGVPISTSQVAISAITGMGIALGVLNWETFGRVVVWWIVAPVVSFWLAAVAGRYLYEGVVATLALEDGSRVRVVRALVVTIACYMAFSAGASNMANAVAPLVSAGTIPVLPALAVGGVAMGVGVVVFGSRTVETVGKNIAEIPLEAALIVEVIAATIITTLSLAGVPVSLVITVVTAVIGLGWGRSTRHLTRLQQFGFGEVTEEDYRTLETDSDGLFDVETVRTVVVLWLVVPVAIGALSLGLFLLLGALQIV
ncbi:MAG: anion permease [Halalkalicoccus sp.]|nr:anion permease [Halalkalicoccus sp.]